LNGYVPTPRESEWIGVYDNEDPSQVLVVFQASAGMQCRINQHGELVNIEVDADIYQVSPNSNSLALMGSRQRMTFVEYSDEGQMLSLCVRGRLSRVRVMCVMRGQKKHAI
jgi:hypothetical protein